MLREPLYSTLTPEKIGEAAFSRVGGFYETLAGSALGGLADSYGVGTLYREFTTPGLSREPILDRPYTFPPDIQFRERTPEESAALGEKRYDTAADYQASPYYRQAVPFEKGMTEARARALATQTDLQAIRDYWGSKRPLTNFAGRLLGTIPDPINYIPIFGQETAATGFTRAAIKAGWGAADAAANTALFGAMTMDERARLGFDTSTFGQDIAFSALAGTVIGGTIGALTRGRGRVPEIETQAPARAAPEAVQGRAAPAATPVVSRAEPAWLKTAEPRPEAPRPRPSIMTEAQRGAGVGKGDNTIPDAALAPQVWRTEAERLTSGRFPNTQANRAKAAIVLNEAIDGLIDKGEVKLGENSKAIVEEVIAPSRQTGIVSPTTERMLRRQGWTDTEIASLRTPVQVSEAVRTGRRPKSPSDSEFGRPLTEEELAGPAIEGATYMGGRILTEDESIAASKAATATVRQRERASKEITTDYEEINPALHRPQLVDFSSPAADESIPESVTQAEARVTSVQSGDMVTAETKAAKDIGIDVETGKHDLEEDIAQLREREALTAEEEEALKAADETYAAATAWEDVLNVARTCFNE